MQMSCQSSNTGLVLAGMLRARICPLLTSTLKQTTKHTTKEKNKQLQQKDISIFTITMRTRLTCNALLSQPMQQQQQ